jgi:hypothetical protein
MVEYKIRIVEGEGAAALEDACNELAAEGWRLVSTSMLDAGGGRTRTQLFFEREGGHREPQDVWREQHGGHDAG